MNAWTLYNVEKKQNQSEEIQWSSLVFTIEVCFFSSKIYLAILLTFGFKLHCRKNRKQIFFKFLLNKGTKIMGLNNINGRFCLFFLFFTHSLTSRVLKAKKSLTSHDLEG